MSEVERVGGDDAQKEPKVIKRYTNRKLYDTEESRYVTLEEIGEMIKSGAEVKIVDNRSKEDLTSVTLTQIILEEEKKSALMPLNVLREIIRTRGKTLTGYVHSGVEVVGQRVASIREEAQGLRQRILGRDGAELPEEQPASKAGAIDTARELASQGQKAVEDFQKRIDERVHEAVDRISSLPSIAHDIAALEGRIRELEQRLEEIEKK